jgi:hypothetical protein
LAAVSWFGRRAENVGDLMMGRQKPLHLPWRLESLHDPLSSSGRLMGILRPVVKAFVLAVLDGRHRPLQADDRQRAIEHAREGALSQDGRRTTEVAIAVRVLNPMLELERPISVRIA